MKALYGACRAWVQPLASIFIALACLAAPAGAAAQPRTVLVMGDSLSAGYGLAASQGWVSLTAQRMRRTHPGWRMVNASISGETTAGGASRIASELARTKPSVVVIELGANDGLRGLALTQTRSNLDSMIRAAVAAKARVLVIGMRMPPNFGQQYTRAFEKNYLDLSRRYRTAYLPFLLAPVMADRGSFQADNLHPTAAAQPKLRDHVWPALQPLLK